MLIDTHCHLDFPQFEEDREEVYARALAGGVRGMVNVGTDAASSRKALELASGHEHMVAAAGIHPHEAAKAGPGDIREIEQLASERKIVAIGETGLDFHYPGASRDAQERLFAAHLDIARLRGLPVIVHQRDAVSAMKSLLDSVPLPGKVVFHCFGGDMEFLHWCIGKGFFVSFTGIITFGNARAVRSVAAKAPLDRVFLETDAPYLAPAPMRGGRNEPYFLRYVLEAFASVRDIPVEQAESVLADNAVNFFNLSRIDSEFRPARRTEFPTTGSVAGGIPDSE